ncbi:11040_t:CDS:2, partial [Ambispora leptoticha]
FVLILRYTGSYGVRYNAGNMFSVILWSRTFRPGLTVLRNSTLSFRANTLPKLTFGPGPTRNKVTPVNSGGSLPPNDAFLQGNATNYIEEMYEAWLKNPSSVDMSWQAYFKNMEGIKPMLNVPLTGPVTSVSTSTQFSSDYDISDHMKVQLLVRAYQVRGHHIA